MFKNNGKMSIVKNHSFPGDKTNKFPSSSCQTFSYDTVLNPENTVHIETAPF